MEKKNKNIMPIDELIKSLKANKTWHELPNSNTTEYNRGYVAAINNVLNLLKLP